MEKSKHSGIHSNLLQFEFDSVGFDSALRLVLVETDVPHKLAAWFDQCPVLAIHRLGKSKEQIDNNRKTTRYLILMDQRMPRPTADQDIKQSIITLNQALAQQITKDTILFLMMKCIQQCRVDENLVFRNINATDRLLLPISKRKSGIYQAVIEVQLKNHILQTVSRTFRKVKSKSGYVGTTECLKWLNSSVPISMLTDKKVNNKRQLTDFFSLTTLAEFERTKLGIFTKLIDQVSRKFAECFDVFPVAQHSSVIDFTDKAKMNELDRLAHLYRDQQLNFVVNKNQENEFQLFKYINQRMSESQIWQAMNGKVTFSKQPRLGLNIQVLSNTNDKAYLCSSKGRYIQHITFESFGSYDEVNDNYHWNLTDKDIIVDPMFQTTLYQLMVKRDLLTGCLMVPIAHEITDAAQFHFFMFKNLGNIDKTIKKINVIRLIINRDGTIKLDSKDFSSNDTFDGSELAQVAQKVLIDDDVAILDGAVVFKAHLFLLKKTKLITIPNIEKLKQQMNQANGENIVERQQLIDVAQKMIFKTKRDTEIQQQLIHDLKSINKSTILVNELKNYLTVTWQYAALRKFNNAFHESRNQWLYLPVRQTKYNDIWSGIYGMGLVEIKGECYYFVGRTQAIKLNQATAVPWREIVAIDSETPKHDTIEAFKSFKNLMQVGFVRLNQYTVLPFPFKYIREYIDLVEHKERSERQ